MSAPIDDTGLGLLDPETQQLLLQIRHLRHVFDMSNNPPLVTQLLRYRMSTLSPIKEGPYAPFFVPEFRRHETVPEYSLIYSCCRALDHFHFKVDLSATALLTLLEMPLKYMISEIPEKHWLYRHPKFETSDFLVLGTDARRLRLKIESEYTLKP
ncbi:hypothetical protein BY458DRAFT_555783 [Sporodiniella umbellata]|nr:hypothetical protein BY458DRAFT_555783 [Sporodiniella umbellata]